MARKTTLGTAPADSATGPAPSPLDEDSAAPVFLKKPEFIERVVNKTDVKKRDAKLAIEAGLAVLVDALLAGEDINFPPMGKIKVVKAKELGNGAQVLTLKLRTMKDGAGQGKTALADDEDDG